MRKLLTKYYENKIKKEYIKQEELFDEISKTVIAINLAKDKCNTCCLHNNNICNSINACIINDNTINYLLLKKEKLKQKLKKSSYKIAMYNLKQSSL